MKHIFLLLAVLSAYTSSYACDCEPAAGEAKFCHIVATAKGKPMFCLVQARIVSWYHWGMYVEVLDNIYNSASAATVLVWGDNAACCRPGFASHPDFNLGDTLILSLEQTDLMGNTIAPGLPDHENPTDYMLPGCGAHYLRYSGGKVMRGAYDDANTDTLDYAVFRADMLTCLNATTAIAAGSQQAPIVTLSPNPAGSQVSVTCLEVISELMLVNSQGRCVRRFSPGTSRVSVDMRNYPAGIYSLIVGTADGRISSYKVERE